MISQRDIELACAGVKTTRVPLFKPYASPQRKTQRAQNLTNVNKSGELKQGELKIITQMTFITKGNKLFYVACAAFNYPERGAFGT